MSTYILALDQGTTSSRAIVFDQSGSNMASAQFEFEQYYPRPGWVEHDPLDIYESMLKSTSAALSRIDRRDGIAAVGITNQRETTIVWERDSGRPVYNAVVWQCRRTADMCENLREAGLEDYITEKTGLLVDAYFSATKLKWILDNIPGARARAKRGELLFGTIDTWLIWKLTGGRAHVTDYTNASRTMLFDIGALKWDETLCDALDIPMQMLPEPMPSSCLYGKIAGGIKGLERLEGVPITGAAGDQQSALFGQACFDAGQAKNTYGTGCFLLMNTGCAPVRSRSRLITTIAWGLETGKAEYALEGSIFNAGSVINWMRDQLGMITSAPEIDVLAESVPDTGGVYFVPAFTGLGAPYWDMYARGTMVGLTRGTTRAHIARAVLESIAYQTKDLIGAMERDSGVRLTELRVDGGAAVSNILMQFQSDMLGARIDRPASVETTALGAAYLAGLCVGYWKDKAEIASKRRSARIFEPSMDEITRGKLYNDWKRAVERAKNWII
jgi:glycerol kinase